MAADIKSPSLVLRGGAILCGILLVWASLAVSRSHAQEQSPIDRRALVERHNPVVREVDSLSPLTVGNGQFAFTADVTGLQSFPEEYAEGIPLSTQSEWGWHTFPNPEGYELSDALVEYDSHGRPVPYASNQDGEAGKWLRASPHRLGLGRIGLEFTKRDGSQVVDDDLENIEQTLNLWNGILTSKFSIEGEPVSVETVCHPTQDAIAVRVSSKLIAEGRLKVNYRFAYGSDQFGKSPEDWTKPEKHTTVLAPGAAESAAPGSAGGDVPNRVRLHRALDADSYFVDLLYSGGAGFTELERHHFQLSPAAGEQTLEFTARFTPQRSDEQKPTFEQTQHASSSHWSDYWQSGGAIELAESTDPRAAELERRIVLSQYLMAVNCAGHAPPQETGLTFNSWFGKSHLEMHWWHAVHFALWDRLELLERGLGWYDKILPRARETARLQGYRGARWPKMVGPDGRESPSKVGVFLLWQQPHPIYYAELVYRQKPTRETLQRFREMVFATADFLASYAYWDEATKRYVLGPPMIPAQEHYNPRTTFNPPYELEYWHWALGVAREWRKRLGEPPSETWDQVHAGLSPPPVKEGVYETAEGQWVDTDHPSHLMALGFLPGQRVDADIMRRTLDRVMDEWQWDRTWGWDYPMVAMTAARVGKSETAIDALMMEVPKNRYLANGHNHQDDRLPIYLPGNGGLLSAVAMMAAGWDGAPDRHAPGFPENGQWQVKWEGLKRMP